MTKFTVPLEFLYRAFDIICIRSLWQFIPNKTEHFAYIYVSYTIHIHFKYIRKMFERNNNKLFTIKLKYKYYYAVFMYYIIALAHTFAYEFRIENKNITSWYIVCPVYFRFSSAVRSSALNAMVDGSNPDVVKTRYFVIENKHIKCILIRVVRVNSEPVSTK